MLISLLLSICHRASGLPKSLGMQDYLQFQISYDTQLPSMAEAINLTALLRSCPSLHPTLPQQSWSLEDVLQVKTNSRRLQNEKTVEQVP